MLAVCAGSSLGEQEARPGKDTILHVRRGRFGQPDHGQTASRHSADHHRSPGCQRQRPSPHPSALRRTDRRDETTGRKSPQRETRGLSRRRTPTLVRTRTCLSTCLPGRRAVIQDGLAERGGVRQHHHRGSGGDVQLHRDGGGPRPALDQCLRQPDHRDHRQKHQHASLCWQLYQYTCSGG